MNRYNASRPLLIISATVCFFCPGRVSEASPEISAFEPDTIRVFHEAHKDLTGDGEMEHLTVSARGPGWMDLDIRLEIRTPSDSMLYFDNWRSSSYFRYVHNWDTMSDVEREKIVRNHIKKILGDQHAIQAELRSRGHRLDDEIETRRTISWDVARHIWQSREASGRSFGELSIDEVRDIRDGAQERVDALYEELKDQIAFHYFKGGEIHSGIAWSEKEQRFVLVYSCC